MSSSNAGEIDLGNDFGDVIVRANGSAVEISADGSVHSPPGSTSDSVAKRKVIPEIGDEMEDGTIYAGISPDTLQPMFTTPADAPGFYTFDQAATYARNLDAYEHNDYRAPTKNELDVLWQNRNKGKLKGTFNESGSDSGSWYWSHQSHYSYGWAQRFIDRRQSFNYVDNKLSLRCVR